MKVVELLKIGGEMLKLLHENGISVSDYEYLPLLADYQRMKDSGDKTSYVVFVLSRRYGMCERKVYKVLKRLLKEC